MKVIKRILTIVIVVCCMYVTAKWPEKVVTVSETGYRITKAIVVTIKDNISSGARAEGAQIASMIDSVENYSQEAK